jgi:Zn-dependent protease
MFLIFSLLVLIFSVMVHEVSHGAVAYKLGDDTAKAMGRLNLNPLNHIDPVGSIFMPLFLLIINSPILFGWAKPVPYNPLNLKNPKSGAALIGAAGPLSNFAIALLFGILGRFLFLDPIAKLRLAQSAPFGDTAAIQSPAEALFFAFMFIIFINLLLGIFNLVPIAPLDGSKILFALLPPRYREIRHFLEQYGMFLLLLFIFFGIGILEPLIRTLYFLIAI